MSYFPPDAIPLPHPTANTKESPNRDFIRLDAKHAVSNRKVSVVAHRVFPKQKLPRRSQLIYCFLSVFFVVAMHKKFLTSIGMSLK
jgi:hypothetical protein